MSKLPKDKRDKIIIVSVVTIAACAAVWFLVIGAQRESLKVALEKGQASKEQLARGEAALKTQPTVSAQFEEATRQLQQREVSMAAPNDMYSWLIQTLNNFRLGYRVEIPQFGRELPTAVGMFSKFPYQAALFTVRGSAHYQDFGKFLADFENNFPCIRVQNIELDPVGAIAGSDNREKLNFKMELVTLVRPTAP